MNTKTPPVAKKRDDLAFDLEQQFILRLPPGPAIALRRDVQAGAMNLKDKLSIELAADMRHGKVTYGGEVHSAKLVDLPCIIDSLKTTDNKTFYKTADIAQMLICTPDDEVSPDESEIMKKKDKEQKYKWNHGITPPMKNVRRRRFRKTLKKKYQEQPDVEKEVKRLYRMDNEAIDVQWEVVIEADKDGVEGSAAGGEKQVLAHGICSKVPAACGGGAGQGSATDMMNMLEVAEYEIFGEVSSSSEDDEDEKEVNIMDSGAEEEEDTEMMDTTATGTTPADDTVDMSELQLRLDELHSQLELTRQRKLTLQLQIAVTDSDALKEKLQTQVENLTEEESKKDNEYKILTSLLNQ